MESGNFTCWANCLDALRKALNSPFQFYISCLIFLGTDASAWAQHSYIQFPLFIRVIQRQICVWHRLQPSNFLTVCSLQIATHLYAFQKNTYIQKSLSENTITKIKFLLCDVTLKYPPVIFQLLFRWCPIRISVRNYLVMNDIFYGFSLFCK